MEDFPWYRSVVAREPGEAAKYTQGPAHQEAPPQLQQGCSSIAASAISLSCRHDCAWANHPISIHASPMVPIQPAQQAACIGVLRLCDLLSKNGVHVTATQF